MRVTAHLRYTVGPVIVPVGGLLVQGCPQGGQCAFFGLLSKDKIHRGVHGHIFLQIRRGVTRMCCCRQGEVVMLLQPSCQFEGEIQVGQFAVGVRLIGTVFPPLPKQIFKVRFPAPVGKAGDVDDP